MYKYLAVEELFLKQINRKSFVLILKYSHVGNKARLGPREEKLLETKGLVRSML